MIPGSQRRTRPVRGLVYALLPLLAGCEIVYTFDIPGIGVLLQSTVGAAMWLVANLVYFDKKRKGVRGFWRFLAFWFGIPTTWITFFMVREGYVPVIEPPRDDDAALFREVRRDRLRRAVREGEELDRRLAAGGVEAQAESGSEASPADSMEPLGPEEAPAKD